MSVKDTAICPLCGCPSHRHGCPLKRENLGKDKTLACPECGWFHVMHSLECSKQDNFCLICGKPFWRRSGSQYICSRDYYVKCIDCGKLIKVDEISSLNKCNTHTKDKPLSQLKIA